MLPCATPRKSKPIANNVIMEKTLCRFSGATCNSITWVICGVCFFYTPTNLNALRAPSLYPYNNTRRLMPRYFVLQNHSQPRCVLCISISSPKKREQLLPRLGSQISTPNNDCTCVFLLVVSHSSSSSSSSSSRSLRKQNLAQRCAHNPGTKKT